MYVKAMANVEHCNEGAKSRRCCKEDGTKSGSHSVMGNFGASGPLACEWGNYMYGIIRAISIPFRERQGLFPDRPSTESFPHIPLNVNDGLCNKAVALIYSAYRGGKSVTLEDMPLTRSPSY